MLLTDQTAKGYVVTKLCQTGYEFEVIKVTTCLDIEGVEAIDVWFRIEGGTRLHAYTVWVESDGLDDYLYGEW